MCLPKFDTYQKLKQIQTLDVLIFFKIRPDVRSEIHLVQRDIVSTGQPVRASKKCTLFFVRNTLINNARLKLKKKNQANAKQHHESVVLLFDNYSYSSSTLSFKNNETFIKIKQKSKCVFSHEIPRLIIIKIKMEMKNRSHRYGKNRPRFIHGHKCSK